MPSTEQIVQLLIQERDKLNRAIEALGMPVKRRGRPPKNPIAATPVSAPTSPKRRRRTFTPEQRAAQAAKMRAYWAKRRKANK